MEDLTLDRSMALIGEGLVAHIGVVDGSGPYVTPVSYVMIESTLYFRTGAGRRLDAIKARSDVCVEVSNYDVDTGSWESAVASGVATLLTDDEVARVVVGAMLNKYSSAIGSPLSRGGMRPLPDAGIIVAVQLLEVTGRSSGTWFTFPTRPGRL